MDYAVEIEVNEVLQLSGQIASRSRLKKTWRNTIVEDFWIIPKLLMVVGL